MTQVEIVEVSGDLFAAPDHSVLTHAVNSYGMWGSGVALAFKQKYLAAFEVYNAHCKSHKDLQGTCLLIPPQPSDYEVPAAAKGEEGGRPKRRKVASKAPRKRHWVACLFTSKGYGKPTKLKPGKDEPDVILANTREALKDLRRQVEELEAGDEHPEDDASVVKRGKIKRQESGKRSDGEELGELHACQFNSGSFGVEWEDTRKAIEEVFKSSSRVVHVVIREE